MRNGKKLVGLALLGVGLMGVCSLRDDAPDIVEAEGTKHVVNQLWIERIPTDSRDMIGHLVLVRHQRGRIGGIGKSSQWRHFVELFQWGLEGNVLSVYFPQDDAKGKVKVRSWNCKGEAPEPFELCLELSTGRRAIRYYSREDWVIDPHHVQASIDAVVEEHGALDGLVTAQILQDPAAETDVDFDALPETEALPLFE